MASDSIPRIRIEPADEDRTPLAADPSASAFAGDLADAYTPVSRIGKGGMGEVYLARDRRLGRFVAIKRLNDSSRNDAMLRRRFLREAHAMAALNHIHIVHVYALGEDAAGPYIVMEYVAGPFPSPGQDADSPNPPFSLEDLVKRHGPLEPPEAAALVSKIARAAAYAHSTGVIHRDLKPANVLIDATGEPKLADFGLAHVLDSSSLALTLPGEKMLSLGYAAPEQESGAGNVDERADVYGLGGLLYFTLTGRNPRYFREQDVPEEVRAALVSALALDREKRCPSAKAFAEALSAIAGKTEGGDDARDDAPAQRATWRCKWCDALNPATLRFCTSCGWDGSAECPECGEPTFYGMRYCQNCGADARAYESAAAAERRIKRAMDEKRWADVPAEAARARGFVAIGPNGRKTARAIAEAVHAAAANARACEDLAARIPEELRSKNYERAREMILRLNSLARGGDVAFAKDLAAIPDLIFERDAARAARAARERDFRTLAPLLASLEAARPDAPELRGPAAAMAAMRARKRRAGIAAACAAAACAAAACAAAFLPYGGEGEDAARAASAAQAPAPQKPASSTAAQEQLLRDTMTSGDFMKKLEEDGRFDDPLVRQAATPVLAAAMLAPANETNTIANSRAAFLDALAALGRKRAGSLNALAEDYRRELEERELQYRYEGDTDGVEAMSAEIERLGGLPGGRPLSQDDINPAGQTAASPHLSQIRAEYSHLFAEAGREYVRDLAGYVSNYVAVVSELRKASTQKDDRATAVRLRAEEKELEKEMAAAIESVSGEAVRQDDYRTERPDQAPAPAAPAQEEENDGDGPQSARPPHPRPPAPRQPAQPQQPAPAARQPEEPSHEMR